MSIKIQLIVLVVLISVILATQNNDEKKKGKRSAQIIVNIIAKSMKKKEAVFSAVPLATLKIKNLWNSFVKNSSTHNQSEKQIQSYRLKPTFKRGKRFIFSMQKKNYTKIENRAKRAIILKSLAGAAVVGFAKQYVISKINETIQKNFMDVMQKKNDTKIENRAKRAIHLAAMVPTAGKIIGWGVGMTAVGLATSYADTKMKEAMLYKSSRITINCSRNNFGCIENVCWSNCGPRLTSADWCFTSNGNVNDTSPYKKVATCKEDADCDPCWQCVSSCIVEGDQLPPH